MDGSKAMSIQYKLLLPWVLPLISLIYMAFALPSEIIMSTMVINALFIAAGIIATWLVGHKMLMAIAMATKCADATANGDYSYVPSFKGKDELSHLLYTLGNFTNSMKDVAVNTDGDESLADIHGKIKALDRVQAIIEFDLDGTILTANKNFCDAVGYDLDEIKGRHHSIFVDEEFKQSGEYKEFWNKLNRGEFEFNEYKRFGKGGKEIWIQASYNPLFDENGNPYKVVKFATDITNQKLENIENDRIRRALDSCAESCLMVADENYDLVYTNKGVEDMFVEAESDIRQDLPHFRQSEVLGSNIDIFHKNPSHQRSILDGLKSAYRASLTLGGRSFNLVVNPIFGEENERIGTVVEWRDRTEEVEIEKEVDAIISSANRGDLSKRANTEGRSEFFNQLSAGLNSLLSINEQVIDDVGRVLSALANGRLQERIETNYEGAFAKLKDNANETVTGLHDVISNIKQSAITVSTGSSEIAQGNTDLSQRTEEQASSLEETASSMEEMTTSVRQNSESAEEAKRLAISAQESAVRGGEVVGRAVDAMEEINSSSKKISDIIGVIDEIAFQTNLLALNAAVEAARAGEQGKGFAVVAGEVRNLAQRSAGAAKEIKDLIRDSVEKVNNGSELVNRSGQTLAEINSAVEKVTVMIKEISAASEEQASGIEQVNTAVSQMDEMTQQNAALVEEASAASETMTEQAQSMMELVEFFTLESTVSDGNSVAAMSARKPLNSVTSSATSKPMTKHADIKRPAVDDDEDDWQEF